MKSKEEIKKEFEAEFGMQTKNGCVWTSVHGDNPHYPTLNDVWEFIESVIQEWEHKPREEIKKENYLDEKIRDSAVGFTRREILRTAVPIIVEIANQKRYANWQTDKLEKMREVLTLDEFIDYLQRITRV